MKHLDLFTGIGGWSLGLQPLGFVTTHMSDIDPFCAEVIANRFPDVEYVDNVRNVRPVEADIITGSFPCQPFSRASQARQGYNDERYLWPYMHKLIEDIKPTYFAIENVASLSSFQDGPFFADVGKLSEEYAVVHVIATASSVGAPHRRSRLFVMGVRHGTPTRMQPIQYTPYWAAPPRMTPWFVAGDRRIPKSMAYGNAVVPQLVTKLVQLLIVFGNDTERYTSIDWNDAWGPVRTQLFRDAQELKWIKFRQQKTPFYTPITSDYKGSTDKGRRRASLADQARQIAREHGIVTPTIYPNPDFMGWLMGFPEGWLNFA